MGGPKWLNLFFDLNQQNIKIYKKLQNLRILDNWIYRFTYCGRILALCKIHNPKNRVFQQPYVNIVLIISSNILPSLRKIYRLVTEFSSPTCNLQPFLVILAHLWSSLPKDIRTRVFPKVLVTFEVLWACISMQK